MARKLDSGRLYGLIKILVIGISLLSLFVAVSNHLTQNENETKWLAEQKNCIAKYQPTQVRPFDALMTCSFYYDMISDQAKRVWFGYGIGVGLPILFFGVTSLGNYLFPKKEVEAA